MPIDLSEDTEIETIASTPPEVQDEFEKMVQGVEESAEEPADEPVEEAKEEVAEERSADVTVLSEPTPTPPVVEGPTVAAKMAAEQAGIPRQLVELATSDEQLSRFVELARQSNDTVETPVSELELPEDEYPENDPVRKAFTTLQSQLADVQSKLKATESKTSQFEEQQKQAAEVTARQTQEEFDSTLNELGIESLGNTKNLSNANFHARSATYNLLQELKGENPNTPVATLAKQAAEMLYPTNNLTPKAKDAIRKQSNSRLGKGPSQPAEPGNRSEESMMRDFLKASGLTE